MSSLVAATALAIQYAIIVLMFDLYSKKLAPLGIVVTVFLVLLGVGIAVWDSDRFSGRWAKVMRSSVVLGVLFFGTDTILAYLHTGNLNPFRFGGGLLGIPLTLAVCPGFTMVCVAGLLRSRYVDKASAKTADSPIRY